MGQTSRDIFRKSALLSGLVSEAELRAGVENILKRGKGSIRAAEITERALSEQLVLDGVITAYQADQLRAGRTKLTLGPYIITDWIGQGGMGQVFNAVHEMLGRESAVKVLPLSKATPDAIKNFRREIRTQAQLDHPNLVRAYDAGEDGNVQYLVVEYVPGTDLRRLVRTRGRLSVQQAANVIMQSARGLEYAHQQRLIHRDVKPGNILVTPDGIAKVSDLGLAGFLHETDSDPRKGKIVGTADYLAPEQITNPFEPTKLSDIYSLGCTLYYSITGKVPYPGGNAKNKAQRHLEETPWHPRRFNEEVSDEFVDLIADMMEKDPSVRIQSMAEVVSRLEPWASDASPLLSQQMVRSRWMPAPLPTGSDDEGLTGINETGSADFNIDELVTSEQSSISGGSQGTFNITGQDTRSSSDSEPPPPPLVTPYGTPQAGSLQSPLTIILITSAVAVPISLFAGVGIGLLLAKLF